MVFIQEGRKLFHSPFLNIISEPNNTRKSRGFVPWKGVVVFIMRQCSPNFAAAFSNHKNTPGDPRDFWDRWAGIEYIVDAFLVYHCGNAYNFPFLQSSGSGPSTIKLNFATGPLLTHLSAVPSNGQYENGKSMATNTGS